MAKVLIGNVKGDKGKDGRGISKIQKTASSGLVDTYTATFSDGTDAGSFTVTNGAKGDKGDRGEKGETGATGATGAAGRGISRIAKTSTSGLVDTYTTTYTDGTASTYTVTNGAKGDKGDRGAKGDKGDAGITVPASGLFSLGVDNDGNLVAYYSDAASAPPRFEYDRSTGNVYYIIQEG